MFQNINLLVVYPAPHTEDFKDFKKSSLSPSPFYCYVLSGECISFSFLTQWSLLPWSPLWLLTPRQAALGFLFFCSLIWLQPPFISDILFCNDKFTYLCLTYSEQARTKNWTWCIIFTLSLSPLLMASTVDTVKVFPGPNEIVHEPEKTTSWNISKKDRCANDSCWA